MPGRPPQLLAAAGAALALHAAAALWLDGLDGGASPRPPDRPATPVTLRLAEPDRPSAAEAAPAEVPKPAPAANTAAGRDATPSPRGACPSAAGLDRVALPYSQPDWQALDGSLPSGQPLRLRLHIDALGRVRQVDAVAVSAEDAGLLRRLRGLLKATRYVPARQTGQDVSSCLDLVIEAALPD